MFVINDLFYLPLPEWLGIAHYHNYLWQTFSTNHVSALSFFCIIYVTNVHSAIFNAFLQRQIVLVSEIWLVHFFDCYIWKMDLNFSRNVDIFSSCSCASVYLFFYVDVSPMSSGRPKKDIESSKQAVKECSILSSTLWCEYTIFTIIIGNYTENFYHFWPMYL